MQSTPSYSLLCAYILTKIIIYVLIASFPGSLPLRILVWFYYLTLDIARGESLGMRLMFQHMHVTPNLNII